jgi:protease-4
MKHCVKFVFSILALSFVAAPQSVNAGEKDVVALFKIKGPMREAPDASGLAEIFGDKAPPNMFDMLQKLREARSDEHCKAVIFDIEEAKLGFSQIQELRNQFEALRAAEKDVWVYVETLNSGTLLLGSAASHLVMMPTGEVFAAGLYGEGMYFKKMMDHLGVTADIIHCGAYKSAGEPFYLEGPSKESEEQTNHLLDSIYSQLLDGIAKSRKLSKDKVRELIDRGNFDAKTALEEKLVDKLQFREDFIKTIRKNYGEDTKVVRNYGKKKGPEIDFENPFAIFKLFGDIMKPKEESSKPGIAIVYVEGAITSGETEQGMFGGGSSNAGSDTVRKAIDDATADESVKALILRVDSPGGSAIASDVIAEATKRFKKSGRPFVVSMGNVAGSGGYYVATMADSIFAEPATITGSIGVVGGKIVTKGFWDWVGITGHEFKRGKHADLLNTNRKFNEEERTVITTMMNNVYDQFKNRVLEGRKDKIKGDLEELAGGRVYTGEQARKIGLIDTLGGFGDTIKYVVSEAELGSNYELKVFPKPKNFLDIFAEALGGKEESDEFDHQSTVKAALMCGYIKMPNVSAGLESLRAIDPLKARCMENFLINLELLSRENVLLIGPTLCMPGL